MKLVALGKVAQIDRTVASDEECQILPYVGLEHIEKDTGHFSAEFEAKPETLLATKFKFTSKHVLYGKLRPYLNKVALPSFCGVCTTEILPILPNEKELDRTYLWAIFLSSKFVDWASSNVAGANLPRLSPTLLAEYPIPLPPLDQQKRIAAILTKADHLRRLRRYARELSGGYLQSVFLEMFGDPVSNPRGWSVYQLKTLISSNDKINYGVVQPGDDFPGGIPIVRVGDFDNLTVSTETLKRIDPAIETNYKRSRLRGDEVLIACVGSIGRIALASDKLKGFNVVRAVARVPINSSLNRLFLASYLATSFIQEYFTKETRTVLQPTLNIRQIEETPILLPPLPLQQKFAQIVQKYERLRAQQREAERQAEQLFQALLGRVFENRDYRDGRIIAGG